MEGRGVLKKRIKEEERMKPPVGYILNNYSTSARWIYEMIGEARSTELAASLSYPTSASGITALIKFQYFSFLADLAVAYIYLICSP